MGISHALLYVQRQLKTFYQESDQLDKIGKLKQIIFQEISFTSPFNF